MSKGKAVSLVVAYLVLWLIFIFYLLGLLLAGYLKSDFDKIELLIGCVLMGGVGGVLYCLRGVYISFCVDKNWDNLWLVWYFIRPINSLICGGCAYFLLKAGLIVLESSADAEATNMGFYFFSFIAGLNVDKFVNKMEDLAKTLWGIEGSRARNRSTQNNSGNSAADTSTNVLGSTSTSTPPTDTNT